MVDLISLCQLYKQQKITKVKSIHKYHDPADFTTKSNLLSVLKKLLDSNLMNICTTKWVELAGIKQKITDI